MPKCLSLLVFLLWFWPAYAEPVRHEHPYVVYAELLEGINVDLSDGSQWEMDKGDCFPIYMYKDHQTKVVLQLGSATFATDSKQVRVVKDGELPAALASYRKNVEEYIKSKSENWKKEAK